MAESPASKGFPWLLTGLLLLGISISMALYDVSLTDESLRTQIQQSLQQDFANCLNSYGQGYMDSLPPDENELSCTAAVLTYHNQELVGWTQTQMLPDLRYISTLGSLPGDLLLSLENRKYYQIRSSKPGDPTRVQVVLIPLEIRYAVNNDWLRPLVFFGRWQEERSRDRTFLNSVVVTVSDSSASPDKITLYDLAQRPVMRYETFSLKPFRISIRYAVLLFLMAGLVLVGIFLRIFTLRHWNRRFWVLGGLTAALALTWWAVFAYQIPQGYFETRLFDSNVLAFSDWVQSPGDLTIHIIAAALLAWIIYFALFRQINRLYRHLLRSEIRAWAWTGGSFVILAWMLDRYHWLFQQVINNSKVPLEYSNLFKTDTFSFLLLLDMAVVLLIIAQVAFLLLKLPVLHLRSAGKQWLARLALMLLLLSAVCAFFFYAQPARDMMVALSALLSFGLVVYRQPWRNMLHQDLLAYFILVSSFSLVITHEVTRGNSRKQFEAADVVANKILQGNSNNILANIPRFWVRVKARREQLVKLWREKTIDEFREHIQARYLNSMAIKGYDLRLALLDSTGQRLDTEPLGEAGIRFGPRSAQPYFEAGQPLDQDTLEIYEIPNPRAPYADIYACRIPLNYDGSPEVPALWFYLELTPSRKETEGLYPALSFDQRALDEAERINAFDHALYRQGQLAEKQGQTPFPTRLPGYADIREPGFRSLSENYIYLKPLNSNPAKIVAVSFPRPSLLSALTTFSFIFYFLSLAAMLLVALPALGFHLLRSGDMLRKFSLKSKIRFALVAVSLLPMIIVMSLLNEFVTARYETEAREELMAACKRFVELIRQQEIRIVWNEQVKTLDKRSIENLEQFAQLGGYDLNIFDNRGRLVAASLAEVFEAGISSELMNDEAFRQLSGGTRSDLIFFESLGNRQYLSAFQSLFDERGELAGFVNIPYIGKQDELRNQTLNFLSYLANIYLLVFLLINAFAVVLASGITRPLSLVQQRIAATRLGNYNEPIAYGGKDEIGAIVRAYNSMVERIAASEDQLKQSQRELAWRQMARQVAHEIKNPLTPMRLSIQHLMRTWTEQSSRVEKVLPNTMRTLLSQIDQMVRIANSFSEFARMPDPVRNHITLNEVLYEVVDLYAQSGEEINWLIHIPQEPCWVYADRDQLSRCFNNIIKNALQALEGNGIIHISLIPGEKNVRVEIKDNGKGMSDEVKARAFEPSFSTKTTGMGLGLAIVKRIIEQAGGEISFVSAEGVGTTFFIDLPRSSPAETAGIPALAKAET